ncbi:MAG: UDP-N-acetylmuramoyl-tripeptide--D-alanyl-D-alanine ligase [Gammaproteobacteria bacterium]|nr:UDP-N-acetylmuramoyl-tripeptide--D-alanyl-D-alanine ligase [Gammaproteobacteria bacterium]MCF6229751.1 UDP-N-acetylmuramoyl-tripeptide--D-alanyl-D-alanine ligase [Gammaproteobacteria bacterium]
MMTLQQAATFTQGECRGEDVAFDAVSIDTRTLVEGSLYVAIRGEQFDGHHFIAQAEQQGARCVMVESIQTTNLPQLVVSDCRLALGDLARHWREELALTVVGITGSNGKTTVKEILAAILAQAGPVLATKGNLNNDYGVPLTLLSLQREHQFAVVEMGANHRGEIAYLTQLARPDVAVVNNAGRAHLEGFGSEQGVAIAKGEIYGGLTRSGRAIINRDDQYADYWTGLCEGKQIVSFALHNSADIQATWRADIQGSQLEVETPKGAFSCQLALRGEHNVRNALAATAAAFALGIDIKKISAGIEAVSPVKGRLKGYNTASGASVIDDSYNANLNSYSAAIEVLKRCSGKRILVMADMAELGESAEKDHCKVGEQAARAGIDVLYALGKQSQCAVEAFEGEAYHFLEQNKLIAALKKEQMPGNTLLVKGSRSMAMERVVEALLGGGDA